MIQTLRLHLYANLRKLCNQLDIYKIRYIQNLNIEENSIESLGLSTRACMVLNRNNVFHIKELIRLTENELLRLKDLGGNSVAHIKNKLMLKNLSLSP